MLPNLYILISTLLNVPFFALLIIEFLCHWHPLMMRCRQFLACLATVMYYQLSIMINPSIKIKLAVLQLSVYMQEVYFPNSYLRLEPRIRLNFSLSFVFLGLFSVILRYAPFRFPPLIHFIHARPPPNPCDKLKLRRSQHSHQKKKKKEII